MPQKRHVVDQNVAQLRKADVELVSEKEKRAKKGGQASFAQQAFSSGKKCLSPFFF